MVFLMVSVPQKFLTKFEITYVPGVLNVMPNELDPHVEGSLSGSKSPKKFPLFNVHPEEGLITQLLGET
jgi:hypothetical protein